MARPTAASLAILAAALCLPGTLTAQDADTLAVPLPRAVLPAPRLVEPAALRAPWLGARTPQAAFDSAISSALDSARTSWTAAQRALLLYGRRAADTVADPFDNRSLLGIDRRYADLSIDGRAAIEIRTERVKNERCTPAELNDPNANCGGRIRAPRLDNVIDVRSSGLIGQRVHVDVDFQSQRDFGGNNQIRAFYQGLPDEIVQRVEVGTVTFRPPASRFLTAAVPNTNFGVNGLFEVGPMQFQALFATQKGSSVGERTFTIGGESSATPQDRILRDVDFESGRFFWVIDPAQVPGYPALDILELEPGAVPAPVRPEQVRVYRYRAATANNSAPTLGGIKAYAENSADPRQRLGQVAPDEGAQWELLSPGRDYYLDPSGLWFVLSGKLDPNDYLAVSYTTVDGGQVGTFPNADRPEAVDSLELIVEPRRGPDYGTFRHEMRQVYRVAGLDLDRSSLQVGISLNRSERPQAGEPTYLAQLELAVPTDAAVFDRENRLFPRTRDPGAEEVVREAYIIFPHLTPFADASRLTATEVTDSLYRVPLYLVLSPQGPPSRFQFRLQYSAASGADRSLLSLNAIQVKEGSEQIEVNNRVLVRGIDYSIDYASGLVTFLDPDALFGVSSATVRARFEQQDLFAIAPTTIMGLTSRYSLGTLGSVNLVGVFQREASAYNRPQLGFEASANMVGGIVSDLHFRSDALTRALNRVVNAPTTAPSLLDINAEVALSKPDPNRSGAAYLEEFDSDQGTPISLREQVWEFGSAPQGADGIDPALGFAGGFALDDAVALTWQNLVPGPDGRAVQLRSQDVDTTIVLAGRGDQFETVLWMTFHADTAGGLVNQDRSSSWSLEPRPFQPRWRSIVSPLSSTGLDLSRTEYLEFYVYQSGLRSADSAGVQLVFDLGTVNEDAVGLAPAAFEVTGGDTLFTGRQYVGLGRLDTERGSDGIFNAATDDIGILGDRPDTLVSGAVFVEDVALCTRELTSTVLVYPWGDLSSRCTNGNGYLDTEDLNGDNLLNAQGANENLFRYVVDLRDSSLVVPGRGLKTTDAGGREAGWVLYRVPLRGDRAVSIGTPNLRLVQHLRVTVIAPPDDGEDEIARFALARMRLVGAPWSRRAETPIAGISGATGQPHGEVITATVSTENIEVDYESPPGVRGQLNDRNAGSALLGTQVNEKSLRVIARDLREGERAEAYLRFPAGAQNVLNYRELRVWARGFGEGWERGDLQAFVKLGSDDINFYMYRAPAFTTTWEPEMVVDLETWRELRSEIEERWLRGEGPSGAAECGGDPTAYVACSGGYIVHLGSPGINPPNLAAVQEISAGMLRVADLGPLAEAEVWIDDIRLLEPVSRTGTAMAFDARLVASDVGDVSLSYLREDGQFRQIGDRPTYRTTNTMRLGGTWRLDRFLPASLGIALPATVSYSRATVDPQLISGTDIRGSALDGLRKPESWAATYSFTLRRSARGSNWLVRGLVDPLTITGNFTRGQAQTELSRARSTTNALNASYNLLIGRVGPVLDLGGLVPGFLRNSEGGQALRQTQVSLAPTRVTLTSGIARDRGELTAYQVPIMREQDVALLPTTTLNQVWRNSAGLSWQPLGMLTLTGDLSSTRDLRHYPDSTSIGRLAEASRRSFLGMDVGVERDRQLGTSILLAPRISSWLRPRLSRRSGFTLSRSLTSRPPVQVDGDTAGMFVLPQTLNNSRVAEVGATIDIARLAQGLGGDSSVVARALGRVRPLDVSSRRTRGSTFDLAAFDPDLSYLLAAGGQEDFLQQAGALALGSTDATTRTLTSGADLPLGLNFALSYSETDATRFQRVGTEFREVETNQTEWPVGTLRWSRALSSGPLALVAVGATVRRRTGHTIQPVQDQSVARTAVRSTSLTPDVQFGFRNGLTLTLRLATVDQENDNNGTINALDQTNIAGTANYSFRLPEMFSRSRKRVSSSLTVRSDRSSSCLERPDQAECTVVSNTTNQEVSASFRTDLADLLRGGLDFGYLVNEASHLNRRLSTIYMTVQFELSLFAGDLR